MKLLPLLRRGGRPRRHRLARRRPAQRQGNSEGVTDVEADRRTAKQVHSTIATCVAALQIQIARLQTMAGNPELLRAEVPNWRAEQCRQAQAALRERQLAEARREAGRKRREADVKAAAERHAVEERTREQQRMAAAREERERQAVAAPGGRTQDLQRIVRFVSTWTQP